MNFQRAQKYLFFGLTLWAFALPAEARRAPYLASCGEYELIGRLDCRADDCLLVVRGGSLSELRFHLKKNRWLNGDPANGHVRVRARIEKLSAGAEGYEATAIGLAERSLPDDSIRSIKKMKELPCRG